MKSTIYVRQNASGVTGGHVDPLFQGPPRDEPGFLGVKITGNSDDYDHDRWEVPQGDDYDGVIFDKKMDRWVEGPPPLRQYGFVLGPETLAQLGLAITLDDGERRSIEPVVVELVEGMTVESQ